MKLITEKERAFNFEFFHGQEFEDGQVLIQLYTCEKCNEQSFLYQAYQHTEFHFSKLNPKYVDIFACPCCNLKSYVGVI